MVSPSQPETPRDGSCLFHALLDQCSYIPDLRDVASNHQELQFRIINYGYDFYLKTGKINWAGQSETPEQWKKRMSGSGEWGDEVCLNLACNVLHLTETQAWTDDLTHHLTETKQKLGTEKAKNEDLTHLTISLTKEKIEANLDTPSTSITVKSHGGAAIKHPQILGQYDLVDSIMVRRKPVYRKGDRWIFYGRKSLVE